MRSAVPSAMAPRRFRVSASADHLSRNSRAVMAAAQAVPEARELQEARVREGGSPSTATGPEIGANAANAGTTEYGTCASFPAHLFGRAVLHEGRARSGGWRRPHSATRSRFVSPPLEHAARACANGGQDDRQVL